MKKILMVAVVLLLTATAASASFFDNSLATVWESRKDLQKAFPGDPNNNSKLETWAKRYGWQEDARLFSYYPYKTIIEKIVENKYETRINNLEQQLAQLTARVNQLPTTGNTEYIYVPQPTTSNSSGNLRKCWIHGLPNGEVECEVLRDSDYNDGEQPLWTFYIRTE